MTWLSFVLACRGGPSWPTDQTDVRLQERTFVDDSRDTPELLNLPFAPERVMRTLVWTGPSPGAAAPHRPLLLLCHGHDGLPDKFDAFARALASQGLVVAALQFPSSHLNSGAGILSPADLGQQPADISHVLDGLVAAVEDPDDPLWHQFDPDRVVVLGHSLGGATVLGWTRFGVERPIRGTILLSAAEPLTVVFGAAPEVSGPPTLLAHGTDDPLVSFAVSETMYTTFDDPVWLLGIEGGVHSDAIEDPSDPPGPSRVALEAATLGFVDRHALSQPGALGASLGWLADQGHDVRW